MDSQWWFIHKYTMLKEKKNEVPKIKAAQKSIQNKTEEKAANLKS